MKFKLSLTVLLIFYLISFSYVFAAGLEERTITLSSNERFDLVQASSVNFKFKPLSDDARKLEITKGASSLGVAYLGQVRLKENTTALSALRSIADQIGDGLDINFGVIADSNTSDALKTNELLLLYHPHVIITLALARPDENNDYEIICTYALKDLAAVQVNDQSNTQNATPQSTISRQGAVSSEVKIRSDIAPTEDLPNLTQN